MNFIREDCWNAIDEMLNKFFQWYDKQTSITRIGIFYIITFGIIIILTSIKLLIKKI